MAQRQSSATILMIEPIAFGYNFETGTDNSFQNKPSADDNLAIAQAARGEMQRLRLRLEEAGVKVVSFFGQPHCPDDVFPNNWLSTTPDGKFIVYPMATPSRRQERRDDILHWLRTDYQLLIDLSAAEESGDALEGTGVLVQDHVHKRVYVARSQRTSDVLLNVWSQKTGYEPITFDTEAPGSDQPVYHTNVICHVGTGYAAICPEMIKPYDRARVLNKLGETHEVIRLTPGQIVDFCGNALEVSGSGGQRYLALSERAHAALTDQQRRQYERHIAGFLHAPIPTIERYGGGSVRCMMCQLF